MARSFQMIKILIILIILNNILDKLEITILDINVKFRYIIVLILMYIIVVFFLCTQLLLLPDKS
jgi:hypothetical protein